MQSKDFHFTSSVTGPVSILADRLYGKNATNELSFRGNVTMTGKGIWASADRMDVQTQTQITVLSGHVKVVEGGKVILCDRLEFDPNSSHAILNQATFYFKKAISDQKLSECQTVAQLRQAGWNAISLSGSHWLRNDQGYEGKNIRFTTCDCGDEESPSWEIGAQEADVVPGEQVWMKVPIIYIKGIPVLPLPVLYLPMSERRTGLLMPQFNYVGRTDEDRGWMFSDSLFVTLGDHADTTLSLDSFAKRGLKKRLEFRARPFGASDLTLRLSHIADRVVSTDNPGLKNRFTAQWDARADGDATAFRSQVRLFSDSGIKGDFAADMADRIDDHVPSSFTLSHQQENQLIFLDAIYFQDQRGGLHDLFASGSKAHGRDPVVDTIHRLGAVSYQLTPIRISDWPVHVSLFAESANLSSFGNSWLDLGADSVIFDSNSQPDPDEGEGDRVLSNGELRRAFRLLLEPKIRWDTPFHMFHVYAHLAHRQMVYLPHGPQAPKQSTRGISSLGVGFHTEFSRSFGQSQNPIGHVISPSLQLTGVFQTLGSDAPLPYLDLQDRLFDDALQALFSIDTGLYHKSKNGFSRFVGLNLSQGLNLKSGEPAQLSAILSFDLFPLRSQVNTSWDWNQEKLAELSGSLSLYDRRGDSLSVSYLNLPSRTDPACLTASNPDDCNTLPLAQRTQGDLGLLFGSQPLPYRVSGKGIHVLQAGITLNLLWGFKASGSIHTKMEDNNDATASTLGDLYNWWSASLAYQSNCHCWGFSVSLRWAHGEEYPDVFFMLDLGLLGSTRAGTVSTF
jgi:hypothetical protein